jgi:MFS family permease
LFNRNFVLLWQGQLVSQVGSQAFLVAMMFWTMEATGSASLMGLLMMVSALPGVLLGPVAGTFVDRHSRLRIIIASDVLRGAAVLALAGTLWLSAEATAPVVAVLFVVAVFNGVVGAVFNPNVAAAIPDLVPPGRIASANSLQSPGHTPNTTWV